MHAYALHVGPASRESLGEHGVVQFAVGVRGGSRTVFEGFVAAKVTVRAHKENPRLRLIHKACQDVWRKCVDGEDSGNTVRSDLLRRRGAVTYAGVVCSV